MAFEQKANCGALFVNEKRSNPNAPDFRGDLYLDRAFLKARLDNSEELIKIQVSAWKKESKTGTKFLSLSASEPYVKEQKESTGGNPWDL